MLASVCTFFAAHPKSALYTQGSCVCQAPGDSTTAPLLSSPSSQDRFQLGIFSSASALTVSRVVEMVHQAVPAAPEDPPGALFSDRALVFTRQHTQAAPQAHVEMGGKDWDTIKPLHSLPCCQGLQQVLLVDDDAFKVRPPGCWARHGLIFQS